MMLKSKGKGRLKGQPVRRETVCGCKSHSRPRHVTDVVGTGMALSSRGTGSGDETSRAALGLAHTRVAGSTIKMRHECLLPGSVALASARLWRPASQ